ncbi:hypothetical protein O3M35_009157 [Rhynocoris fuscipes]
MNTSAPDFWTDVCNKDNTCKPTDTQTNIPPEPEADKTAEYAGKCDELTFLNNMLLECFENFSSLKPLAGLDFESVVFIGSPKAGFSSIEQDNMIVPVVHFIKLEA